MAHWYYLGRSFPFLLLFFFLSDADCTCAGHGVLPNTFPRRYSPKIISVMGSKTRLVAQGHRRCVAASNRSLYPSLGRPIHCGPRARLEFASDAVGAVTRTLGAPLNRLLINFKTQTGLPLPTLCCRYPPSRDSTNGREPRSCRIPACRSVCNCFF